MAIAKTDVNIDVNTDKGKEMETQRATTHARQEVEKFVVRLPKGMRAQIAEVSRLSHRSMNSEIIARLEESLGQSHIEDTNAHTPTAPLLRAVDSSDAAFEQEIIARVRRLSLEKRAAVLELLS
jgi:Arc-like DNA binding dprotein